jgi:serine/threonine protein kinase
MVRGAPVWRSEQIHVARSSVSRAAKCARYFRPHAVFTQGQLLENKYRIGRLIGQGGMGAVYEAEAVLLHRRVAIKVQTFGHGTQTSGEMAMRFQLEAQAAGRIGSRHIVDVIDLGRLESGEHFMVMEYLDGQSLRDRIDSRGGMTAREAYPIAQQLLVGLSAAHAAGIVHRDLKPENIFLVRQADGSDFVKILDFGISKFNDIRGSQGAFSLTRTGALMGTPRYLSPEQATGGKAVDQRTDIYMVGVILYECLTGSIPYEANTFNELLFQIVQDQPRPIRERNPSVEANFAALVECAMHKDPKHRFQSADEMSEALRAVARGETFATRSRIASGAPEAPTFVSAQAPVPRLSVNSGMAAPPHESAAKSWSQSHAGPVAQTSQNAPPSRSKVPLALAAVAVVLAGGAYATVLKLRSAGDAAPVDTVAVDESATKNEPSKTAQGVAPPPVAPVVVAPPVVSATAAPAAPATAAARRDARSAGARQQPPAAPVAPTATQAAVKAPEATPTSASPAASANLPRIQGGGRIIRGKL